ncbi:hypothetical protein [Chitinophaga sp. sic0106]|uniref:hypothetical protein n=1 Tax=Chitinophaga sp. sic0106 TaxID=2854785 RepID=UPI001C44D4F2|nr:hypothetical protein [Chitinophaga sp. sic0106]MBV7531343.1 hypothetical protein [Chitinophaga sp. sic0106]
MANLLNQTVCARSLANTGTDECFFNPAEIAGAFKVPGDRVFTQAELDSLMATLEAGVMEPVKEDRIFPLHGFLVVTDNSEETVFETVGSTQIPVRDGHYRWTFRYIDGGMCLSNALRSHNFTSSTWIFYDKKRQFLGWRKQDETGAYGLAGVPVVFFANKWGQATATTTTNYSVYFDIDPFYLNDQLGFYVADFDPSQIKGLRNIKITQSGASAAGVIKVILRTSCAGVNLYDKYSTELAAVAAFSVQNFSTEAAITITSVAADANIKGFTLTLSSSDPDYPASATNKVVINTVDPTALDAIGVSGFEGVPLTALRG